MKQSIIASAYMLAGLFLGFLLYETFFVFGLWPMLYFIFISVIGVFLNHFIGCKTELVDGYTFNPKETPKYFSISMSLLAGIYLYSRLVAENLSSKEKTFGIIWIAVLFIGIVIEGYRLYRDRNDYVNISGNLLAYRDNENQNEISLLEVEYVSIKDSNVILNLFDGKSHLIKTSQMNFGIRDIQDLTDSINETLRRQKDNL